MTNIAIAQTATAEISITLPSFSLLDIAPNLTVITLTAVAPTEAGLGLTTTATNNTKYINFTSAVAPGVTRRITAQATGNFPLGLNLNMAIGTATGAGGGVRGSPITPITVSTIPQTIVNNIGGGFTANGSAGFRLTFSLAVTNYAFIVNDSYNVAITYTIIDN